MIDFELQYCGKQLGDSWHISITITIIAFKCSNVPVFWCSNVQNVHMHRDSSGRGVRSNWWFWIGVCAALLVSAATDQGTPLLGRILLLISFSHSFLFFWNLFRILFYILLELCLCLQPPIKEHRYLGGFYFLFYFHILFYFFVSYFTFY